MLSTNYKSKTLKLEQGTIALVNSSENDEEGENDEENTLKCPKYGSKKSPVGMSIVTAIAAVIVGRAIARFK
ncbi:hypothetical protein [Okeania sp. SIO2B3]|uniref:hypothetical protein n=1 Tax=Okeania sp. SIO2B3 TaxID=2607784 RepID=UPI0013BF4CC2|nr:hypothetical protein [Okeania sp. SIO2B3]NET40570.1 hypothetical protein [Okeania sp. SIO2B3]